MTKQPFTGEIEDWIDPETTGHLFMNDMAAVAFCDVEQRQRIQSAIAELTRLGVPQDRNDARMRSEGMQHAVALSSNRQAIKTSKLQAWHTWMRVLDILNGHLLNKLTNNTLVAFGDFETAGKHPQWISPRTWHVLRPDRQWALKMVGGGAVFWNVRVVDPRSIMLPSTEESDPQVGAETVANRRRTGTAGRPSSKALVVEEMRFRAARGDLAPTLAEEARDLCAWLRSHHPNEAQPLEKSLSNSIRVEYKQLRDA